jgi:IclR family pca regulon transcriptional regulator
LAAPLLEQLSEATHESCSVSVLEGNEIVYVARSAPYARTVERLLPPLQEYAGRLGRMLD